MAFKPGQSGNPGGRKKGSTNKFTNLKAAFLQAFQDIGGVEGLVTWGKKAKNRPVFYQMVAKMLPKDVYAELGISSEALQGLLAGLPEAQVVALCAMLTGGAKVGGIPQNSPISAVEHKVAGK